MNTENFTILSLIAVGALISFALHWLIGVGQKRMASRYVPATPAGVNVPPSIKKVFIDWIGNALRTSVWLLFAWFAASLLPQTRSKFESVGARLTHRREQFFDWIIDSGVSVIIVIIVTIFLMRFASALSRTIFTLVERGTTGGDDTQARRRLQTLSNILSGVIQLSIGFIGLMVLLQQLKVNVTPILASAGVVGIAVGFGAQSLIKDLFAGFLILMEDQFSVGDLVRIGEHGGTVEQLTLRVTRIRGVDGALTTIPNGSITTVSNLSKGWSRAVMDIEVDYTENIDRAMEIMLETAREMRAEQPENIIEEPSMLGVDQLSYTSATLRMFVKTAPTKHFETGRELRRRIKLAFEREGIRTPLAKQQLLMPEQMAEKLDKG
ncbi:MAG: mechanosensitive ion channel family protein [Acidobacteriota bacterium]|nr:MAG: mechanosensitive ion channel family protein [Acidobacteriota bacterium]